MRFSYLYILSTWGGYLYIQQRYIRHNVIYGIIPPCSVSFLSFSENRYFHSPIFQVSLAQAKHFKTNSINTSIFITVLELVPVPLHTNIVWAKKVKHFDVDTSKYNYKLNDWHFVYAFKNFWSFFSAFLVKVTSKSLVSLRH